MRICCQNVDFDPDVWKVSVRIHGVFSRFEPFEARRPRGNCCVVDLGAFRDDLLSAGGSGNASRVSIAQHRPDIVWTLGTKRHGAGRGSALLAALGKSDTLQ